MEDKILIKSEKNAMSFLKKFPIFLSIAIACALFLSTNKVTKIYSRVLDDYYVIKALRWNCIFGDALCFLAFLCGLVCLVIGVISAIIYFANKECELCITENNVKGKTHFGKEVVLPLHMVSAYSTRKFLSTVAVSTASGITKFPLIKNYIEIGEVLAKKINERQANTQTVVTPTVSTSNNMDDILKLKSLLDSGIITQEEFDAKKKQLLGL